jgi:MGT family glycosyltransferase
VSTIAFVNIGMHGHVNPTLPVVAELARRGHGITYHADSGFEDEITAAGAQVRTYPPADAGGRDAPQPITLMDGVAARALQVLPMVLEDLARDRPDLVVHDAACLWAPIAARRLGVPAVATFTTFAYNRRVPSPTGLSRELAAAALTHPGSVARYLRSRWTLRRRYGTRGLPPTDVLNAREPLNLVFTSRAVHPAGDSFGDSYRFVGPCLGARPPDPTFPLDELRDPVLYASLGTIYNTDRELLRGFVRALAPLAGHVVIATGHTDPAAIGPLPDNVVARRSVPQLDVLGRAALFVTHGGVNSVNEALSFGVPMIVVPQGADQPMVARRVAELGAGLALGERPVDSGSVMAAARRILTEPSFAATAAGLRDAQRDAGGAPRAANEIEAHLAARVGAR